MTIEASRRCSSRSRSRVHRGRRVRRSRWPSPARCWPAWLNPSTRPICLLANTAPVAFGLIGIPVTTLAAVTGLCPRVALAAPVGDGGPTRAHLGRHPGLPGGRMAGWARAVGVAGNQCSRGLVAGCSCSSRTMGPELTDILSSLTCIIVMVAVLKL
ncbi:MAG: L-lactate permease [Vicinamibacterales bacterium]